MPFPSEKDWNTRFLLSELRGIGASKINGPILDETPIVKFYVLFALKFNSKICEEATNIEKNKI